MAHTGIVLGQANTESTIRIGTWNPANPCLGVEAKVDLVVGDRRIPYSYDNITIHGSEQEIRSFAEKIIAALPRPEEPDTCFTCGGSLSRIAGPNLSAVLCPVCDADSSALLDDEAVR